MSGPPDDGHRGRAAPRPSPDPAQPSLGRGGALSPPFDLSYYVEGVAEGRRGTLVQRQKDRSVWRVEEDGVVWFAKRGLAPKRRREIRREAENARALEEEGFGPKVLASGTLKGAQWIVTSDAETGGERLLSALFSRDRRLVLTTVASAVRALHGAGIAMPDLTSEHAFVTRRGLRLIDAARVERHRGGVPTDDRARDLAALLFSLRTALHTLSRAETLRLVRDATSLPSGGLRAFLARVERHFMRLSGRTRWRHDHWSATLAYTDLLAGARPGESCEIGGATFFEPLSMTIVRTLPDRENRTLGRGPDGKPLFFLKVYPPTKSAKWSPAMREVAAIDLFQRAGILVNRLAAYAEDVDEGSMVAVAAARGEPLDDLLRRGVSGAERRALAVQTARIWRRMRECGLRHRDAYPCHLFAAPWIPAGAESDPRLVGARLASPLPSSSNRSTEGATQVSPPQGLTGTTPRFELRLIDMTRAGKAPFPKERWFVKDAAALWHGLPKPPVTRTDAVRWLREYFSIPRLDARAKRFARRVAAKERRIAARQARKAKR